MVENFFQDLEADGKIDMTSEINIESLWYCISGELQADWDAVKNIGTLIILDVLGIIQ